ncbi:hypothetical protein RR46_14541 [Papilio xuthus]|uniref:Uncharacterized protein n=1 Tax=Papilio xuthus TaxID=66420 RepID=A0A194PCT8_PAPXU|nr:hypothetical protein RR46_14541 [Papilio xuthus]
MRVINDNIWVETLAGPRYVRVRSPRSAPHRTGPNQTCLTSSAKGVYPSPVETVKRACESGPRLSPVGIRSSAFCPVCMTHSTAPQVACGD